MFPRVRSPFGSAVAPSKAKRLRCVSMPPKVVPNRLQRRSAAQAGDLRASSSASARELFESLPDGPCRVVVEAHYVRLVQEGASMEEAMVQAIQEGHRLFPEELLLFVLHGTQPGAWQPSEQFWQEIRETLLALRQLRQEYIAVRQERDTLRDRLQRMAYGIARDQPRATQLAAPEAFTPFAGTGHQLSEDVDLELVD